MLISTDRFVPAPLLQSATLAPLVAAAAPTARLTRMILRLSSMRFAACVLPLTASRCSGGCGRRSMARWMARLTHLYDMEIASIFQAEDTDATVSASRRSNSSTPPIPKPVSCWRSY